MPRYASGACLMSEGFGERVTPKGTWLILSLHHRLQQLRHVQIGIRSAPIAIVSKPEAQNLLIVKAGTETGNPARKLAIRATL